MQEAYDIAKAEYDKWIKAALKHKRAPGLRSDHQQADLERAKIAKSIMDKIAIAMGRVPLPSGKQRINVYLEGRLVGDIQTSREPRGFRYSPKGSKAKGEVFSTIAEVKRSVEGL